MSSPKAAAKARRGKVRRAPVRGKRVARAHSGASASQQALRLAAAMEQCIAAGRPGVVSPEALQKLTAAVCKTYAQQVQDGDQALPLASNTAVSATDVMITASALLRAVDLQVFELGMWQSWTGR
jgi:hypothetical protein